MKLRNQQGFTLVEMMVALLIAGIFFTIFVGVVMATFETLQSGDERTVAQQNARVALNYIANDIRHAKEIAPLRIEAYKDWASGGLPVASDTVDPFDPTFTTDVWPIYRQSVDSDINGYISLSMDGAAGDGDEYQDFRDDGYPYDVRALAPNRISLLFCGNTYYPNTRYWAGTGNDIDLDANSLPNSTSAITRVTYEHQLVEPVTDIYENEFSGREKQFNMVVNRTDANAIQDKSDFVIVRTFEIDNPRDSLPNTGESDTPGQGPLGAISYQLRMDDPYLRQPVADHVMNLRFRYWYIKGNSMLEIRYDPDEANIGGGGINTNDGYYRYFDINGHEIFVYYNHDESQMVPLLPTDYDQNDLDNIPPNSFLINGGDSGNDEFERGILLFEGWRFVNAVSITVKTANNTTLSAYRASINHNIVNPLHPDYGMGFIDFGLGEEFTDYASDGTLNVYDPFFQGADNLRVSTSPVAGTDLFDFVEPNMNPNYNASSFTTLQTFVVPPALVEKAERAKWDLRFGLRHH